MSSSRLIGFGLFLFFGIILFTVGLFMIGDRRMLFQDSFEVYTEFARISGLQSGAPIRVAGKDAGEITEINVPASPSAKFRIKMRINEDLHPLVRKDSVVSIQTDGLVGNKFLQIETGTEQSPMATANSVLLSREPFDFADLVQQASGTVTILNETVVRVRYELESALNSATKTIDNANTLISDAGADVKDIASSGNRLARDLSDIVSSAKAGEGTVGKLITDEELYANLKSIAAEANEATKNIRETTASAREVVAKFQGQGQGFGSDLQRTLKQANEVTSDMAEATEALKRNWFFRGFFKKRGYYDLEDVTREEYNRGMLANKDRPNERIWLHDRELFEFANGSPLLSQAGRQRLDAAMAELLRYPRDSVLMVEGYASNGRRDRDFLDSRARAVAVRQYLVAKYYLNPQLVGFMPMGSVRSNGNGQPWDGVALVLFYDKDAKIAEK